MRKPDYCPEWFDISNYDPCQDFGAIAWFMALLYRKIGVSPDDEIMDPINHIIKRASRESMEDIAVKFSDLRGNGGFCVKNADLKLTSWMLSDLYGDKPDAEPFLKAALAKNEEWFIYEASKNEASSLVISDELVIVDLDSTDDEIMADFADWLRQKREERGDSHLSKGRYKKKDFEEWHRLKILAYLDLSDYCKFTGVKLTNRQIGDLLFPEEYNIDPTERVRKVLPKKCEEVMAHLSFGKMGIVINS